MYEPLINIALDRLIYDFKQYPNKYFTEEDVRVHLCHFLLDNFNEIKTTADGDKSIALHAEVRWWGENRSRELSDIMVFDVRELEVTPTRINKLKRLDLIPRKGFSSCGPKAVIELKLRRHGGESDNQYRKKVELDVRKLERIKTWFSNDNGPPYMYVVALDKRNNIEDINIFSNHVTLKYAFSSRHET